MARIRSVHPEQWTDENFVTCSPLARLLALGLRNEADDNGAFEWKPLMLKMRILPADNCDAEQLLAELVEAEQVLQYEVDGKRYGLIRNFRKFQKPKKPSYKHPKPQQFPTDDSLNRFMFGSGSGLVGNQWGTSGEQVRQQSPDFTSDGEGEGEEDKNPPNPPTGGNEGSGSGYPAEFEQAWAAYPKRHVADNKKQALKAWQARVRAGADPAEIVAGVQRYAKYIRGEGKEGTRYVLMPATFFGPNEHYAQPWAAGDDFDWDMVD